MKTKPYLLACSLLILLVIIGAYYQYNKPSRNLTHEQADLSIEAIDLYKQFSENEAAANKQYLDKVVQVRGSLKAINRGPDGSLNLTLASGHEMGDVTCEIPAANVPQGANLQTGQNITVKGQCTGILMDVVLVKCVLVTE